MGPYNKGIAKAVKLFWSVRNSQHEASADQDTNRGAVVGGKQMDGFIELLRKVALDAGVPSCCIYTQNNYLPGYFRSSKDWDFLIVSPRNKLIATIELKSQIGSYGNNFNNRTEEAIGSAVDLWTAFRENVFPEQQAPWVGYLMVAGKDDDSTKIVRNQHPFFPVQSIFENTSYLDRYKILCHRLILERHYTAAALLWTESAKSYGDTSPDTSIASFLQSLYGHLIGKADEFK